MAPIMAPFHRTGQNYSLLEQPVDVHKQVDKNINNWHKYQVLMKISKAIDKNVNSWKYDNLTQMSIFTKISILRKISIWQKYQFWQKHQFWQKYQHSPHTPHPIWWFRWTLFAVPKTNSNITLALESLLKVKSVKETLTFWIAIFFCIRVKLMSNTN